MPHVHWKGHKPVRYRAIARVLGSRGGRREDPVGLNGQPGDFGRCVLHLGKFLKDPEGYCNLAHHAALGIYPATHAAMEHKASGRADMGTPNYDPDGLDDSWDGGHEDLPDMTGLGVSHMETAEKAMGMTPPAGGSSRSAAKLGSGARFKKLSASLAAKGAHDPGALAAWIGRRKYGKKAFTKLASAARGGSGRAESLGTFYRSFPLEDVSIRAGDGGRTVEAYAAVFNTPAEVRDQDGHYIEELDPSVFNKAISDAAPQGGRKSWRMGVFYNHGMTILGTPSDRHSMPVGTTLDMKADSRGLWTLTRYNRSELADEILENIREGSIPGYSFSGNFRRSQPLIPAGGFRPHYRTGDLQRVRRTESTLKEYGPTPFPVYEDAAVLGMRAEQILGAMASDPELAMRMISMFRGGTPLEPLPASGTPCDEEPPPRSRVTHSGRSVKEEITAARAAFLLRYRR